MSSIYLLKCLKSKRRLVTRGEILLIHERNLYAFQYLSLLSMCPNLPLLRMHLVYSICGVGRTDDLTDLGHLNFRLAKIRWDLVERQGAWIKSYKMLQGSMKRHYLIQLYPSISNKKKGNSRLYGFHWCSILSRHLMQYEPSNAIKNTTIPSPGIPLST